MSVALAIHAGACVMLAADTRRTHYDVEGRVSSFADDVRKAYVSRQRIVTGTGSVGLLEDVANALLRTRSSTDLLRAIERGRERFAAAAVNLPAFSRDHGLRKTSWFFSDESARTQLRLLRYHPALGHELKELGRGACAVMIPVDDDDDPKGLWPMVTDWMQTCQVCDHGDDVETVVAFNAKRMREIVMLCARLFPTVSERAVVTVHPAGRAPFET